MKHIDKLFKEKLYNHEAPVPEGMWEKIAPIAEEESGRALVWFWLAGALALMLGGYGIYKMINSDNPQDPSTLAFEERISIPATETTINSSLVSMTNSIDNQENTDAAVKEDEPQPTTTLNSTSKPVAKKKSKNKSAGISNTVESITPVSGVPANLVITKSYINKEGSIIKQSNLSENMDEEIPVYDVIINSETKDVNAGALLRIIEPLENIPLPALQKQLKKKNTTTTY